MSRVERTVLTDDLESRKRQKQEIADLNDRLATFLKELLRLDWSNQSLDSIRSQWEINVKSIIQLYQDDVSEAEKLLERYAKDKGDLDRQINGIRTELAEIQNKIKDAVQGHGNNEQQLNNLLKQLYELEMEEKLLEHRRSHLEEEIVAIQSQNKRLQSEIEKVEQAIRQQENELKNNKDKINAYLKEIEQMEEEHRRRMAQQPKPGEGTFTEDVDKAIGEIRREFETLMGNRNEDLKTLYRSKVQENIKVPVSDADVDEHNRLTRMLKETRDQIGDRINLNNHLRNEIFELKFIFEKEKKVYDIKIRHANGKIHDQAAEIRKMQEKIEELQKRNAALQGEINTYKRLLESDKAMKKLELARKH